MKLTTTKEGLHYYFNILLHNILHLCTVFCSYLLTKRWVWAYPKDQFDEAINTSNDIERQTRSSSTTSLLTNAIQAFQGCSQCRVALLDHWGIEAV